MPWLFLSKSCHWSFIKSITLFAWIWAKVTFSLVTAILLGPRALRIETATIIWTTTIWTRQTWTSQTPIHNHLIYLYNLNNFPLFLVIMYYVVFVNFILFYFLISSWSWFSLENILRFLPMRLLITVFTCRYSHNCGGVVIVVSGWDFICMFLVVFFSWVDSYTSVNWGSLVFVFGYWDDLFLDSPYGQTAFPSFFLWG